MKNEKVFIRGALDQSGAISGEWNFPPHLALFLAVSTADLLAFHDTQA